MTAAQLEKFIVYLQKENWLIFGPVKIKNSPAEPETATEVSPWQTNRTNKQNTQLEEISIQPISRPNDLILDGRPPYFSFKRFFVPEKEALFDYQGADLKEQFSSGRRLALAGLNILDLQAVNLYDLVFEKDPYYQTRRRAMLLIGHSILPPAENNISGQQYKEELLSHWPFDIFLAAEGQLMGDRANNFKVFTGSIRGQRILEHFGQRDYHHIQFAGPIKDDGPDTKTALLRDKLKNSHNQTIWDELGARCLECGKCTIVCPTCFCFRQDDESLIGPIPARQGQRSRCWDACFYQEFSEVAGPSAGSGQAPSAGSAGGSGHGGHKFLNTTAQRIHFWYYHKFARIPDEFGFKGCVGCHRCAQVCPVDIDISKVLKDIEES